jgi:hypothetical protein
METTGGGSSHGAGPWATETLHIIRFVTDSCSVSRGRPHKVDKRMVLEYTHGLFIT